MWLGNNIFNSAVLRMYFVKIQHFLFQIFFFLISAPPPSKENNKKD